MSNKIDLDRIRDAYANMYDEELLDFAKNEGLKITADAFIILRNELSKRKIGVELIHEIEHEIILQASFKSKRLVEDIHTSLFHDAIQFSLAQKKQGVSNYDIYAGLIEMGIDEGYSNYIVNKLPEWTDGLLKDSKTEFQVGMGILVLGIAAIYFSNLMGHFEFGAALLILFGIGRIILWSIKKNNYQKILDKIIADEENHSN